MIDLLRTLAGFTVSVAWPPLNVAVPSVFFLIRKVATPPGTPVPGASGSTSAVRLSEMTFFFFSTACGTRTTSVPAWTTDCAIAPDWPPRKLPPPP